VVELKGKPGAFDRLMIHGFESGERVPITFTLTSPTPTAEWETSAAICAIGKTREEVLCLHNVYASDTGLIQAKLRGSATSSSADAFISAQTVPLGAEVKLTLVLQTEYVAVELTGGETVHLRPTFPIAGYSIGCIGATCTFTYPE
jgi:hypothetical protein